MNWFSFFSLKGLFYTMSTKTKQKKMGDYVTTTTTEKSNKRAHEKNGDDSESKKQKSGQVDLTTINFACEKKSSKDETWNFKIVSWNVAGIRAWLKVIRYQCYIYVCMVNFFFSFVTFLFFRKML